MMGTNYSSETVWGERWAKILSFGIAALVAMLLGLLGTARFAHAADFTVTNTDDSGAGSLRQAIEDANAAANSGGPDLIKFAIPGDGPHTIAPTSQLPTISQPVTIDGYTESLDESTPASPNTDARDTTNAVLRIVISGASAPEGSSGLVVAGGSTTIRGLVINGFRSNVSSGGEGIFLPNLAGNTNNKVEGNFIGTDANGTVDVGNKGAGIAVFPQSTSNTIGGEDPADRNLISGNDFGGVVLNSSGNLIENNLIGTDKNGNPLGNGLRGVGVFFFLGTGNSILSNSIFSNEGLGIELNNDGVTPNDGKDGDTGPNNLQNFPVLSSATRSSAGHTTIVGSLKSTPKKVFTIQFFSSPQADPSGFGEGKEFLGELNVRTGRRGTVSFRFITLEDVAAGEVVTATATAFSTGDTSEFSAVRTVVQGT
jgi:trimeric autotransporter adhesin